MGAALLCEILIGRPDTLIEPFRPTLPEGRTRNTTVPEPVPEVPDSGRIHGESIASDQLHSGCVSMRIVPVPPVFQNSSWPRVIVSSHSR